MVAPIDHDDIGIAMPQRFCRRNSGEAPPTITIGGLLALRRSGRVGMPDESVLKRAAKRTREQDAEEKAEDER